MMFPNKINICGVPFKVVLCNDNFISDTIHFGEIDYKKCEIRIDAEMPTPLKMQTLIHEWLHGVLFMIGQDELRANEQLVQGIAMAIYQTFELKEEPLQMVNCKDCCQDCQQIGCDINVRCTGYLEKQESCGSDG